MVFAGTHPSLRPPLTRSHCNCGSVYLVNQSMEKEDCSRVSSSGPADERRDIVVNLSGADKRLRPPPTWPFGRRFFPRFFSRLILSLSLSLSLCLCRPRRRRHSTSDTSPAISSTDSLMESFWRPEQQRQQRQKRRRLGGIRS